MKRLLPLLALAVSAAAVSADPIRAVQLDLARQKETPEFVKRYMKLARDAGCNTVVLYLEDRIKTPGYPSFRRGRRSSRPSNWRSEKIKEVRS